MSMSKNITDVANWEKDYPFLNEVWEFNNTLNILAEKDKYKGQIFSMCHMILKEFGKDTEEYNGFCLKLLNNLGHYSENAISFIRSHNRCNILYNWIYNLKKKHAIPDDIINKCFEEYVRIGKAMNYKYACSYDTYNRLYKEPINMTLLDIFDDSMKTIENTLTGETREINIPCRKYICESVKIYDDMHQKYCVKKKAGDEKYETTCSRLERFKETYTWFFQNKPYMKDKIPSLDDIKRTYMDKCQKYVEENPVQSAGDEERHTLLPLTKTENENPQEAKSLISHGDVNKGNHMSSTVSTTIGAVAGASSILALLYKFTPGRNWMRSGIRGSRGRISNNLHSEQPHELFYDGFEGEVMSSYNPTYNVGYGSA